MNGKFEIDKDTYKKMDASDQNWILFETFNGYREETDEKIECLQKKVSLWKKVDLSMSAVTGIVGGFLAVIFKGFFKP